MGGAVSAVTEPVSKVASSIPVVGDILGPAVSDVGGIVGGPLNTLSGKPAFKGTERTIDRGAFKVPGSEGQSQRAKEEEERARQRSQRTTEARQKLLQRLEAQSKGEGPSLAEAQLKSASDRSLSQQLAAAASQRGGSAGTSRRQLLRSQAQQGQQLGQDAAQARIQEQLQAQQLLGQQVSQEQQLADAAFRSALDQQIGIGSAQQTASQNLEKMLTDQSLAVQGLNQTGALAAQQAQTNLLGSIGGATLGFMNSGGKVPGKAKTKGDSIKNDTVPTMLSPGEIVIPRTIADKGEEAILSFIKGLKASQNNSGNMAVGGVAGKSQKGLLSAKQMKGLKDSSKNMSESKNDYVGYGKNLFERRSAMISDKTKKKNIRPADMKKFLSNVSAKSFEYKDSAKNKKGAGSGSFIGVMAQDLEKAGPAGKSMVKKSKDGTKMLDAATGFGAVLAAAADMNKRLSELEKKKRK